MTHRFNMFDDYELNLDVATHYAVAVQVLSGITKDLDNFSSSEDQIKVQRITGKFRIYSEQKAAATAVLVRTRNTNFLTGSNQVFRAKASPNSLEGYLGSSEILNSEYGYVVLGRTLLHLSNNTQQHEGFISFSYTPPKSLRRYFVSTEQITDSPTQGYVILLVLEYPLTGIAGPQATIDEYREYHFITSEKNAMKLSF